MYREMLYRWLSESEALLLKSLPDKLYLGYQYFRRHKKIINFKNPQTFNQKIQWLKLYYHNQLLKILTDKYEVRKYVTKIIGPEILINLINTYDKVDEINWSELPDQFVMKLTHGSGWNILCRHKKELNIYKVKKRLSAWMKKDFYIYQREWAYKKLKPRIICEQFISDDRGEPPADYKFFCFNGVPKLIQVDSDRYISHHRGLYDLEWNRLPFSLKYPASKNNVEPPENLNEMIQIAERLSVNLPFVRVDLYSLNNKMYFGEMTIYPGGGLERFTPDIYDKIFGNMLRLPLIKQT